MKIVLAYIVSFFAGLAASILYGASGIDLFIADILVFLTTLYLLDRKVGE